MAHRFSSYSHLILMDKGSNLEQMYLAFFTVEFVQDYEECCKYFPTQFAYVYLYVFS